MKIFLIKNTILSYLAAHVALLLSPLFKLPLFPLLTSQTRCFSGHVTIFRASYSTSEKNKFNKDSDDGVEILLPSCDEGDLFKSELKNVLSELDKDLSYKLEFCLFLHTNDKSKNLKFILGDYNSLFKKPKIDEEELFRYLAGLNLLEKLYEYKGYYTVHSDLFKEIIDLDGYILSISKLLGEFVINTNENLDIDEFVEFKKSTVLRIKPAGFLTQTGALLNDKLSNISTSHIFKANTFKGVK